MRYLCIFATLFFTVYGQLVLKWRIGKLAFSLPEDGIWMKFVSLMKLMFDPFIFSGFLSAFIASLFWMAAMTKFEGSTIKENRNKSENKPGYYPYWTTFKIEKSN